MDNADLAILEIYVLNPDWLFACHMDRMLDFARENRLYFQLKYTILLDTYFYKIPRDFKCVRTPHKLS